MESEHFLVAEEVHEIQQLCWLKGCLLWLQHRSAVVYELVNQPFALPINQVIC